MLSQIIQKLGLSLDLDASERNKIWWLTFTFFCVIGSYTVLKEMKDVLFAQIVGANQMYLVKIVSMFVLFPATLLYAKLVDVMSRFRLLVFYSLLYGVGGIVIAYFLADPVMGLPNTIASKYRYFGWFVYLFYEGLVPFVVSVFWAFCNSVTKPETAKKGYTLIIAGSKLGGMFTAGLAWFMFLPSSFLGVHTWSSVVLHQLLLIGSSIMLAVSPLVIYYLMKNTSEKDLRGYEAVDKLEKQQEKSGKSETGVWSGLTMFAKYPYILGIFGMFFFYELVNVVLGIQRALIVQAGAKNAAAFTGTMFQQRFWMHALGFVVSFFGTRVLVKKLGERICLLLIPIITGVLLVYFMMMHNEQAVLAVFMVLGMLNYSFSSPLREALYIPTVKDIRFKSKAWIESFGQRFSKSIASGVIGIIQSVAPVVGSSLYVTLYSGFFGVTITLWTILAWFLGKKYVSVVKNKEVIGAQDVN
ncbi:MAG: hypothetical protein CL947_02790 [Epsilonproteobacteria bacterium]|nr:hypothetical protein [Campylobacterota bacterium]|tara:strand:+ start:1210 stop:2622 length:1413 start_codon:yes stop_codon:yes gene_type:complete